MIRPPCGCCARIQAKAARAHRKDPVRLIRTTSSHIPTSVSSMGRDGLPIPALLNSASSRPHFPLAVAKALSTDSASPTSHGRISARSSPSAVSASVSCRRPIKPTCQPASRKAVAVARPMPLTGTRDDDCPVHAALLSSVTTPTIGKSRLPVHQSGAGHAAKAGFFASLPPAHTVKPAIPLPSHTAIKLGRRAIFWELVPPL